MEKLIAQPGDKLPVGTPIALIHVEGRGSGRSRSCAAPSRQLREPAGRVKASPMARKLAQELGVDLEKIQGTGPHGVIERHDVEQAAKAQAPARAEDLEAPRPPSQRRACATRSPWPWPGRTARSRITISRLRST